jgi:hypothetical protein
MKKIKRKYQFTTLLLTVLLVYGASSYIVPTAGAAEPNPQEKTVNFLNDVIGLNTEDYTTISSQVDSSYRSLPQKEIDMTLVSNQSSVRARCSFVNSMLRRICLSDYNGDLAVKQPATATVDMAKDFLQRYQIYGGDSFYGILAATLNNLDVSTNVTKSAGNIKLEVLNWNQAILDYVWTFKDANGNVAKSKNVILSFDQGQLTVFLNNWPLYKIAGAPKISSEEATVIALEASNNFSYEVEIDNITSTITGFKISPASLGYAKLSYLNFPNQSLARGGDPFTLYPSWYVPLGFDRSYPGSVTGMTVSVWADTGEVSIMGPMVVDTSSSNMNEEEKSATSNALTYEGFDYESSVSSQLMAVALFTAIGVTVVRAKNIGSSGRRKSLKKIWSALLCGVILSGGVVFLAVPAASASYAPPNSKAEIYGALDGGQGSPAQLQDEKDAAYWVSGEIADAFIDAGYSTSDHTGSGTTKSAILGNAEYDEANYDRIALFHFGHMVNNNWGYVDNSGNWVLCTDIEPKADDGKHFFVFIWACAQANAHNWGTPQAWTNRTDLSSDGYGSPDDQGQAYIGFYGASPIISGYHQTFEEQLTDPLEYFIDDFYDYMLRDGYSVKLALNLATQDYFDDSFTSSYLNIGYSAWWNTTLGYVYGRMRVFGDGNIKLCQPLLTISARDNYDNQLYPTFYIDGQPVGTGSVRVATGTYTFDVSDITGYDFYCFHFDYGSSTSTVYYKPEDQWIPCDAILTVYYTRIPYIVVETSYGGTTNPSPGYYEGSGTQEITATPRDGWRLDWGNYYCGDDNPIYVDYDDWYSLKPVFVPDSAGPYITVRGWEEVYSTEIYPDIYLDGDYFGTCEIYTSLPEGYYTFSADQYYDQFACYYVIVTDGGQWMEWGNSVQIYLSTDTTLDFYYTG